MPSQFLGKSQVQIGTAPDHAVKNLGADLMSLFGAVGKGAETYNTIGVTAAKLEFQTQMTSATDEITQQKILLNKFTETNDTAGILSVQDNINAITGKVHAKSSDFKNHTDAYDEYANASADFGARVRSTYNPIISSTYIQANKNNITASNDKLLESSAQAGVPLSTKDRTSSMEINKANLFDDIENDKWKASVFSSNFHLINAEISKEPAYVVQQYGLSSKDKDGNAVYSLSGERDMIQKLFGDLYTTDENGIVISGKSNGEPDTKEMDTLAGMLGQFRAKVMKPSGSLYSAEFAKYLSDFTKDASNVDSGTLNGSSLQASTAFKKIMSIPDSSLSEEQQHEKQVALIKINDLQKESNVISGYITSAITSGNFYNLDVAKSNGVQLNDTKGYTFNVSASRMSAEADNFTKNINATLTEAMRSGNIASVSPQLSRYNSMVFNLTGKELDVVKKAKDVTLGGTQGILSASEHKDSINVLLQLASDGQGIAPSTTGSRVIQNYQQQLQEIDSLETQCKDNPTGLKNALNEMKATGISDVINNANINAQGFYSYAMKNMDSMWNFGSSSNLSIAEANGMGMFASKKGYRINTNGEAKQFINDNFTRTSMEYFGKVTYRPNNITDLQANEMIKSLTTSANVKPDQTGYKVRFIPTTTKDKDFIHADLMDINGKIIKSSYWRTEDLAKLSDNFNQSSVNPINMEGQSTKPQGLVVPLLFLPYIGEELLPPPPLVPSTTKPQGLVVPKPPSKYKIPVGELRPPPPRVPNKRK